VVRRYEWAHPGELVHVDVKRLARIVRVGHRIHGNRSVRVHGAGWEYVDVAVDDHSRVAYTEVLADKPAAVPKRFSAVPSAGLRNAGRSSPVPGFRGQPSEQPRQKGQLVQAAAYVFQQRIVG
jgi:hypothetical protein